MNNNLFGLSEETIGKIRSVFARHSGIIEARIYGSRAKGNYKQGSDIDIVLVGSTIAVEDILKIENELDDLLLPYKIDLSTLQQIDSADLLEHIQRVSQRFYP